MEFEYLATPRLLLRKMGIEEYQHIFTDCSDERIMELLNLHSLEELSNEKKKTALGRWTHNKTFLYFQLIDKVSQKIIGWCGYHTWYLQHFRAEIGYALTNDEFKQKGLMYEALVTILEYGFEKMQLHRIEAFVAPYNIPSLKLVGKTGFQKEGLMREHYFHNGVAEDSFVFSLLRRDYQTRKD